MKIVIDVEDIYIKSKLNIECIERSVSERCYYIAVTMKRISVAVANPTMMVFLLLFLPKTGYQSIFLKRRTFLFNNLVRSFRIQRTIIGYSFFGKRAKVRVNLKLNLLPTYWKFAIRV